MKSNISKVIIATDFSTLSESAFKIGIAVAKRQNAEVILLHVMDKLDYMDSSNAYQVNNSIKPNQVQAIGKNLDMLAAKIHQQTNLRITSRVMEGLPSEKICAYAYQQKVSLIVMGTHGISGSRELFMGSEAFKIIKNCSCPTLTVPSNWGAPSFKKVLFPVQLKPGTFEKYFYARPIIEKNNSEIIILVLSERSKPDELRELIPLVERFKIQLQNDRISFRTEFSPCTDFAAKVVEAAAEFSADLALIAVNLEDDMKLAKVGPFAQQLLNHLHIPILAVKPFSHQIDPGLQLELADTWSRIVN